ncbi:MAG: ATP-binding protein [Actinomycetota bacterium]|nr:ATP-binding protein [Actinomycetota bacterium]
MKQITVLSGKGGTGKTTVTAALAQLSGESILADCDVEAPNLHLLLHPEVSKNYPLSVSLVALIDEDLCTKCGICEEECRFDAIRDFRVNPFSCEGCRLCARLCPEEAVEMLEPEGAEVFMGKTDYGPMIWACLAVGEEASGKVVSQVRMEAQNICDNGGPDLIITDGSPGIGCPVIASVTGSDLVVMVAEPTLSGRHDLGRALEMTAFFKIPSLACVNKADINPEETESIRQLCLSRGVEMAVEIPYSDQLAESARQARPPLEDLDEDLVLLFQRLYRAAMAKIDITGS